MPDLLLAADGAYPPFAPVAVDVILGYAGLAGSGGEGPTHIWTAAEWDEARTRARWLIPIVVVPTGRAALVAAGEARTAFAALGVPPGAIVVLDREEGRADLTAEWCETFRLELGRFNLPTDAWYRTMGYTSGSAMGCFEGWTYRWLGSPRDGPAPADLAGYTGIQYSWKRGYDLSVLDRALAPYLWEAHPAPVAGPAVEPPSDPVAPPPAPIEEYPMPIITVACKPPQDPAKHAGVSVVPGNAFIVWPNATKTYIAQGPSITALLEAYRQAKYAEVDCQTLANIKNA